jgi:beta-aspartyl-dipeptidase (metallo-type)
MFHNIAPLFAFLPRLPDSGKVKTQYVSNLSDRSHDDCSLFRLLYKRPMNFASRRLIMLLLKGGEIFAPEPMGVCDLLLSPEKILMMQRQIPVIPEYETEVMDCSGLILCPAFIDQHVHLTGGGGEEGPQSRMPEMGLAELISSGIGTAAGLLGADGITRSIAALLVKARALVMDGMSTVIYTGSYGLPTDTLTGRVLHDIAFIDKVVGAGEVAISDYRSSHPRSTPRSSRPKRR